MFVPSAPVARGVGMASPPSCKPFTIHSNVCVGDLVAIIACSIAGIGFFFWAIHAIRKMREFPFNYKPEEKEEPNSESDGLNPYPIPSAPNNTQHGVRTTPSLPERVRTRLALSEPEEDFYKLSAPISSEAYYAQGSSSMRMPRMPPRAGGQSLRTSSRRHGSLSRGGPYGEGYHYGMNNEYVVNVSSPRTRSSPVRRSGNEFESMRRMNADHIAHAY